jgi:HAD superfamily hydrolase (TIGR01490 family)
MHPESQSGVEGGPGPYKAAAFFDLDRTLIRRSSMLALAPALRRQGLIGWGALARASVWHAVYLVRGVSSRELAQAADQTFRLMRGWPVDELHALIAKEIEPLAALAFPDAIRRMRDHQARGEPTVVVSASLIDLVEPLAKRLGLDGAIASRAEARDGRFTGTAETFLHGNAKAEAVRTYAAEHGIDLARSSAYTDSRSDIELLQVVGHPYAVNPDRALEKIARERGWPLLHFTAGRLALAEAEASLLLERSATHARGAQSAPGEQTLGGTEEPLRPP